MRSCIFVFYISGFAGLVPGAGGPAAAWQAGDPDALYAAREVLAKARQAEALWSARVQRDAADFEAAWKLARARYWLGGQAPQGDRKALLEAGVDAGRQAAQIGPGRPEGHFWMAANMGALA